tara:strand:- start:8337 stop:8621 length:285 start_codon:yes stop_codon:yes gene_type:complete
MRSEDVWYGSDPCIDEDELPSRVFDHDVCPVCDKAMPHQDLKEFGIEECDCVECESCGDWKMFEDFCNVSNICDSCYEKDIERVRHIERQRGIK